ncbi:MAG: peptide chain release factor N(5)-glutamine methyltransferase [Nitrospinota bacterium]|nr:MAG: peptide chain release factor N(5)-glutamine methyltransferase [Nitrospinota bacterium]
MTWTIKTALQWATHYLQEQGIESARLDSELLLAYTLGTDRVHLYLHPDRPLSPTEQEVFTTFLHRRAHHEPLAYITGRREFWSLEFLVTPAVLIPRPETELLVEQAVLLLQKMQGQGEPLWVLDIGTGSGNIAVSVATAVPTCRVVALDRSWAALGVARHNAVRHGVDSRVHLVQGDLLAPFQTETSPFALILSNPPYVPAADWEHLPPTIKQYEPRLALDGGKEGIDYAERIIREARFYLRPDGYLLLEMGEGQAASLLALCQDNGYCCPALIKDYAGIDRVLIAQGKQKGAAMRDRNGKNAY